MPELAPGSVFTSASSSKFFERLGISHVEQMTARFAVGDNAAVFHVKAVGRFAGFPTVERFTVEQLKPIRQVA